MYTKSEQLMQALSVLYNMSGTSLTIDDDGSVHVKTDQRLTDGSAIYTDYLGTHPTPLKGKTLRPAYSITLPELWNAHHVGVVAFVNNRDEDNRNNNIVFNAAHATVKDFELGVEDAVQDARPVSVSYYTVDGVRTGAPKGLSIRVARYADGTIRTDKAVR